jgi:hypothetical protein
LDLFDLAENKKFTPPELVKIDQLKVNIFSEIAGDGVAAYESGTRLEPPRSHAAPSLTTPTRSSSKQRLNHPVLTTKEPELRAEI